MEILRRTFIRTGLIGWVVMFLPAGVLALERSKGRVIAPWRATPAIVKSGQSFEGWFDAAMLHAGGVSATQSISSNSTINLDVGSLVLNGNQVDAVNAYIVAGRMTSYHGASTLRVNYAANTDQTTVTAVPFGYDEWASDWEMDIGGRTDDYDNDHQNNFYEYALNGDPTDPLNSGAAPVLSRVGGQLVYIRLQRNDNPDLIYSVETSTNLLSNVWTNTGYSVLGTNVPGGAYDEVINIV